MVSQSSPVLRIGVHIHVGKHLMSATDDPVFLGLRGPFGREFRLRPSQGKALRRGGEDRYVIGAPDDPETQLAEPALNDPTHPPIPASEIGGVYLRKGLDPIPNVRGRGELDDRLEIESAEVLVFVAGQPEPLRFRREGPIWLGLESGMLLELPRV